MNPSTSQKIMNAVFISSGILTIMVLLTVVSYILINGIAVVDFEFLFSSASDSGKTGGIFPMILTSLYLIAVSMAIAIPIAVGSAIYVSEYAKNKKLIKLIRFVFEVLSAIPSIVFGLFGFSFLIFFLKLDWSIFSAGIILAIMSIPTIFQISELTLQSIPDYYRQASFGLGASKWQCIRTVVLPMSLSGIFTGILLAVTRAISEAAAVMYVVGSSLEVPTSIFDAGRPLPLHLYMLASEGISMENAYGTACVLIIIVLAITVISNFFINYWENKRGVLNEN